MICMLCDTCGVISEFTRNEDGTAHEPKDTFLLAYLNSKWIDLCSRGCAETYMRNHGITENELREQLARVSGEEGVAEKSKKIS